MPGAFYSLPGNYILFPLTELGKDWNKWKSKSAMSGKYSGWIRTSQPSCNSFCLVIKETGFPGGTSSKETACQCRRNKTCEFNPRVRKIPWRRSWQPLQYSCLEHPVDRGAWWATVHRVAELVQLKWLSMYSCSLHITKQGDNIQPWHTFFSILNQSVVPCLVLTVAS